MNTRITTGSDRTPFLTALCILTFIGSTVGFIGYFSVSIFYEDAVILINKYSSVSDAGSLSPIFFTLLMFFHAVSLTGAIRMWKLHRDGYFLYMAAQVAILFLPVLWINSNSFSSTNAIVTGIFILGYTLNYKKLN